MEYVEIYSYTKVHCELSNVILNVSLHTEQFVLEQLNVRVENNCEFGH